MRSHLRPAALVAASLVGLLAAAPAYAADVTGGSASAVTVTAGGQDNGTGTYSAQYDGQKTTTGSNQPAISLLGGQSLLSAGTLAQDADANASGSAACAGLALLEGTDRRRLGHWTVALLVAAVLSHVVYPHAYRSFIDGHSGTSLAAALVLAVRNLLLTGLCVAALAAAGDALRRVPRRPRDPAASPVS